MKHSNLFGFLLVAVGYFFCACMTADAQISRFGSWVEGEAVAGKVDCFSIPVEALPGVNSYFRIHFRLDF